MAEEAARAAGRIMAAKVGADVIMTKADYPKLCPNTETKTSEVSSDVSPFGVVVRFRSVFTENITLRFYGQQLLMFFCSWDRKGLEHTLSSYFG